MKYGGLDSLSRLFFFVEVSLLINYNFLLNAYIEWNILYKNHNIVAELFFI
jgi:hypothetical protein